MPGPLAAGWAAAEVALAASEGAAEAGASSPPRPIVDSATTATSMITTTAAELITAIRRRLAACWARRACWLASLRLAASRRIWFVATCIPPVAGDPTDADLRAG